MPKKPGPPTPDRSPPRRVSVTLSLRAAAVLPGPVTPAASEAIDCWATLLLRCAEENADPRGRLTLDPAAWNLIADAMNGALQEPSHWNLGELLANQIRDADRFRGLSQKWAASGPDIAAQVGTLDYAHAWAIVWAVRRCFEYEWPAGSKWWDPAVLVP